MQLVSKFTSVDLAGSDIRRAKATLDGYDRPSVEVHLRSSAAKKLARITGESIGLPVEIVLCGEVVTAPVVREAITGGSFVVAGDMTLEEAEEMAAKIKGEVPCDGGS